MEANSKFRYLSGPELGVLILVFGSVCPAQVGTGGLLEKEKNFSSPPAVFCPVRGFECLFENIMFLHEFV